MDVFLSWSGKESQAVANALHQWLSSALHTVDPWMSPQIEKGSHYREYIGQRLEKTHVGIICLTRDNMRSPWLLFEAGALAKMLDAKICTFLLDLTAADV